MAAKESYVNDCHKEMDYEGQSPILIAALLMIQTNGNINGDASLHLDYLSSAELVANTIPTVVFILDSKFCSLING